MKVLAVSDRHFPWAHKGACSWVVSVARQEKPDVIVGLGDGLDLYSLSPYPRSYNLMTPAEEFRTGMKGYTAMWREFQKAAPKARCVEVDSNHLDRLKKRVSEKLPEIESIVADPFVVPGVERLERIVLEGVMYEHGFRSKAEEHGKKNLQSTVHGHLHSASLHMFNLGGRSRFNLNCGWLADRTAPVFKYKASAVDDWTLAAGLVTDASPRLLLYPGRAA